MRQDPAVMLIQEEAPRPADPLATFDEDYEKAVLHLAWDRHAGTNVRTLLFGFVELLPIEVPPPLDDGEQGVQLGEGSQHWIHLRRVVVPASRALGWYLDCRRHLAVLPDEEGSIPSVEDPAATRGELADLGEEPPWPTLVCVSGESNTVPFCPSWHQHPRVHHLVPLAELRLEQLWPTEGERKTAARWLEDRLHFSLEEYPEYWGSVHLVAPNPVYRAMQTRLYPRMPPQESVLVRFQPRAGKSVEGLALTYSEKEPWGPLDVRQVVVRSPLLRLDYDRKVEGTREDVFDPRRGMLTASFYERVFIRSIQVNLRPVSRRSSVEEDAPRASSHADESIRINISTGGGESAKITSARARMFEAYLERKRRLEVKHGGSAGEGT